MHISIHEQTMLAHTNRPRMQACAAQRTPVNFIGAVGKAKPPRTRKRSHEHRVLRQSHRAVGLNAPVDHNLVGQ